MAAICHLGTQGSPRALTGEYKSTRAWQAASDPAHSLANQDRLELHRLMTFDVTAGEDEGLSQSKSVQIEAKFIAITGNSAKCKQDSRVLTGEQLL